VDDYKNIRRQDKQIGSIRNKSSFMLKDIDLKGIDQLTYRYSSKDQDAMIEVRVDSPKGPLISTLNFTQTGDWKKFEEKSTPVKDPGGIHELHFVFVKNEKPDQNLCTLDWMRFENADKTSKAMNNNKASSESNK
jgi:cytochrome c